MPVAVQDFFAGRQEEAAVDSDEIMGAAQSQQAPGPSVAALQPRPERASESRLAQATVSTASAHEVEHAFEAVVSSVQSADGELNEVMLHTALARLRLVQKRSQTRTIFTHYGSSALAKDAFFDIVDALKAYLTVEEEGGGMVDYSACHRAVARMGLRAVGERNIDALRRYDEDGPRPIVATIDLADFVCLVHDLKQIAAGQLDERTREAASSAAPKGEPAMQHDRLRMVRRLSSFLATGSTGLTHRRQSTVMRYDEKVGKLISRRQSSMVMANMVAILGRGSAKAPARKPTVL